LTPKVMMESYLDILKHVRLIESINLEQIVGEVIHARFNEYSLKKEFRVSKQIWPVGLAR